MSTILSIDTATSAGSVAIHKSGELVGLQQYNLEKSHSSLTHVLIEQLLENTGVSNGDLGAIAISAGPGSYTGLRIGVSTAKGLCYALDIPLIAVNTLEAMAQQIANTNTSKAVFCPMIDARRLEVYCSIFGSNMKPIEETEAVIVDESSFSTHLEKGEVIFFGDGSDKCEPILKHSNARFVKGVIPSANEVGQLAYKKYQNKEFENLAYYEPFYLKEFRIIKSKKKLL
ncbi:MAG: tRNA (adenosine(37)-N6)-threonylcarbamoyltransferase complex dimerization subunit type 1 TsaB [Cyclobacteriaceae bacterium]